MQHGVAGVPYSALWLYESNAHYTFVVCTCYTQGLEAGMVNVAQQCVD
jgi:hypothetical protein